MYTQLNSFGKQIEYLRLSLNRKQTPAKMFLLMVVIILLIVEDFLDVLDKSNINTAILLKALLGAFLLAITGFIFFDANKINLKLKDHIGREKKESVKSREKLKNF